MGSKIDPFRDFMTFQLEGDLDGAVAMLADDVVLTDPVTGTATGKPAVEAVIRSRPPGSSGEGMTWSEPAMEGDAVVLIGTGAPFPIRVAVRFDSADRINKIDIGFS